MRVAGGLRRAWWATMRETNSDGDKCVFYMRLTIEPGASRYPAGEQRGKLCHVGEDVCDAGFAQRPGAAVAGLGRAVAENRGPRGEARARARDRVLDHGAAASMHAETVRRR